MKNRIVIAALLLSALALSVYSSPVNNSIAVESAYENTYITTSDNSEQADLSEVLSVSISTPEQFNDFASKVNSAAEGYSTAVCTLTNNIDFGGETLTPIGTASKPFSGVFDGNGYKISNFVTKKTNFCGVVGYMRNGNIRNLSVENGTIDITHSITVNAGLICGNVDRNVSGESLIENCSATGVIDVSTTGASLNIGGLVGKIASGKGAVNISDCYANVDITANSANSCYIGGFVGHASALSSALYTFRNCYSGSSAKYAPGSAHMYAGGFAGYLNQDEAGWSGWYSADAETISQDNGNVVNCFADTDILCDTVSKENAGGLTGYKGDSVLIVNSYYSSDVILNGGKINAIGTVTDRNDFVDAKFLSETLAFDLNNVWYIHESNLPYLRIHCMSNGAPVAVNGASIRVKTPQGMRFMAFADNVMRSYSAEYGFIVALKSAVGDNELTFDSGIKYASGAAYISDGENSVDKVYSLSDDGVNFTGVLINIPKSKNKSVFVARPYVKFVSGGETVVLYGSAVERSLYQVALAVSQSDEYNNLSDEEKLVIDGMIAE